MVHILCEVYADRRVWLFGHARKMVQRVHREYCEQLQRKLTKILSKQQVFSGGDQQEIYDYRFDTWNRVTVEEEIHDKVSEDAREILSLGPGFVPARRMNNTIIQDVEVSRERLAFGYRWRKQIEEQHQREDQRRSRTAVDEQGQQEEQWQASAIVEEQSQPEDQPQTSAGMTGQQQPKRRVTTLDSDKKLKSLCTGSKQPGKLGADEERKLR